MPDQIVDRRTVAIPGPAGDASPEMIAAARAQADTVAQTSAQQAVAAADIPGTINSAIAGNTVVQTAATQAAHQAVPAAVTAAMTDLRVPVVDDVDGAVGMRWTQQEMDGLDDVVQDVWVSGSPVAYTPRVPQLDFWTNRIDLDHQPLTSARVAATGPGTASLAWEQAAGDVVSDEIYDMLTQAVDGDTWSGVATVPVLDASGKLPVDAIPAIPLDPSTTVAPGQLQQAVADAAAAQSALSAGAVTAAGCPPSGDYVLAFAEEFNAHPVAAGTPWSYWDWGQAGEPATRQDLVTVADSTVRFTTIRAGSAIAKPPSITTRVIDSGGAPLDTARLAWRYGYAEVRAKSPTRGGVWPAALWMQSNILGQSGEYGEIDLMESWSDQQMFTVHHWTTSTHETLAMQGRTASPVDEGWHTYGVRWTKTGIAFYLDGQLRASGVIDDTMGWLRQPMYLIANGGARSVVDTNLALLPFETQVDYIRIWQRPTDTDAGLWRAPTSTATQTLPDGTVGRPYRAALPLDPATGTPSVTWAVAAGTLPAGLTLSDAVAGIISGTPTATGTATFTVTATEATLGQTAAVACTLTVASTTGEVSAALKAKPQIAALTTSSTIQDIIAALKA